MDLRYPVGRYHAPDRIAPVQRSIWIRQIEDMPAELKQAVAGLTDAQLDTPYRPMGWTLRPVVHHFADSHLSSYTLSALRLRRIRRLSSRTMKPPGRSCRTRRVRLSLPP